jgi:MFS family permease
MQRVGQFWLVLHLTGSGVDLGLTAAFQTIPILLFGTWGGLVADRSDKRILLIGTQAASGLLGLVLGLLTLTDKVELWMVYALAACLGAVNVLDNPARQSFVGEMVGPEYVSNAVGLNSAVFTSSRVLGPAVAGAVIALVGTGWCFLYNGLSFFAVVAGLLMMRPKELQQGLPIVRGPGQIMEGLRYTWSRPELRYPVLLMMVLGTFAFNWNIVLPLMARYAFHSGAATYGALLSMLGVGAFVGALFAAGRSRPSHRLLVHSALILGVLMAAAAVAPSALLEMAVLVPVGTAMVTCQTTGNSILQLNSAREFRGRVMSLYVTAFLGTTAIGAPAVGWISQQFGGRAGLALGAGATLAVALAILPTLGRRKPQGASGREREVAPTSIL